MRADVDLVALVRRSGAVRDKLPEALRWRVQEVSFDFGDEKAYARLGGDPELACDVIFCCVGTTMKQAGSKAAFLAVDRDIPRALIARAKELPRRPAFGLVSSTGAARPVGFYLSTKAVVERLLLASGLPHVIVRPSLLLGSRQDPRLGEALAAATVPAIFRVLGAVGLDRHDAFAAMRPIEARDVARALVARTLGLVQAPEAGAAGSVILEGRALAEAAPVKDDRG
jgi:uncharacterized protein YbjT (DUF2867 family)